MHIFMHVTGSFLKCTTVGEFLVKVCFKRKQKLMGRHMVHKTACVSHLRTSQIVR